MKRRKLDYLVFKVLYQTFSWTPVVTISSRSSGRVEQLTDSILSVSPSFRLHRYFSPSKDLTNAKKQIETSSIFVAAVFELVLSFYQQIVPYPIKSMLFKAKKTQPSIFTHSKGTYGLYLLWAVFFLHPASGCMHHYNSTDSYYRYRYVKFTRILHGIFHVNKCLTRGPLVTSITWETFLSIKQAWAKLCWLKVVITSLGKGMALVWTDLNPLFVPSLIETFT